MITSTSAAPRRRRSFGCWGPRGSWIYRNPLASGRLSDDEIAVGTYLDRMAGYATGSAGFYGLAEAAQDHYLSLMVNQALASGDAEKTTAQTWAER